VPDPVGELKRDVIVSGWTLARYPLEEVSLVWRSDEQGSSSLDSTVNHRANQSINREQAAIYSMSAYRTDGATDW